MIRDYQASSEVDPGSALSFQENITVTLSKSTLVGSSVVGEDEDYGVLPNNATHIAPPDVPGGFIPRWNGGAWEQVEDHKGKEGYLDGQPHTVKEHGPLPEGWSDTPPEPTEAELAERRRGEILARLADIDAARSRPLADLALGLDEGFAQQKLEGLEAERAELAAELAGL